MTTSGTSRPTCGLENQRQSRNKVVEVYSQLPAPKTRKRSFICSCWFYVTDFRLPCGARRGLGGLYCLEREAGSAGQEGWHWTVGGVLAQQRPTRGSRRKCPKPVCHLQPPPVCSHPSSCFLQLLGSLPEGWHPEPPSGLSAQWLLGRHLWVRECRSQGSRGWLWT